MPPTKVLFIWPAVLEETIFKNQKQELPVAAMFVIGSDKISIL